MKATIRIALLLLLVAPVAGVQAQQSNADPYPVAFAGPRPEAPGPKIQLVGNHERIQENARSLAPRPVAHQAHQSVMSQPVMSQPGVACDCCQPKCDACSKTGTPLWLHRSGAFAEFLFLSVRDSEVTYASPINGPAVAPPAIPIQVGRMGVVDIDYSTGFRGGVDYCLDGCSSIRASYMGFESNTNDVVTIQPGQVIQPMLLHPSTANAGTNALAASAGYGIDLDQIDVAYRAILDHGRDWVLNYSVGARYAKLEEDFWAQYTLAGSVETVANRINFHGGGFTLGLDGLKQTQRGWLVYGKTGVGFLAGDFRAAYAQRSNFDPSIVDARWRAGRIVTTLDLELGAGFQDKCGRFRATFGYLISGWYNTVQTDEFIQAVRTNNFVGLDNRMTFDGLTARIEFRR